MSIRTTNAWMCSLMIRNNKTRIAAAAIRKSVPAVGVWVHPSIGIFFSGAKRYGRKLADVQAELVDDVGRDLVGRTGVLDPDALLVRLQWFESAEL